MFFRKPDKPKKPAAASKQAAATGTTAKPRAVDAPGYRGPERRRTERRDASERRKAVRWEPDKAERRQMRGRRKIDGAWSYR